MKLRHFSRKKEAKWTENVNSTTEGETLKEGTNPIVLLGVKAVFQSDQRCSRRRSRAGEKFFNQKSNPDASTTIATGSYGKRAAKGGDGTSRIREKIARNGGERMIAAYDIK